MLLHGVLFGTIALVQNAAPAQSVENIAKIARGISVGIQSSDKNVQGSGVIIQKQGDVYTLLTANHVVKAGNSFKLTMAIDDQIYGVVPGSIKRSQSTTSKNIDLAVLQFRSKKNYPVAKIGNSNLLEQGMDVYVVGFPAPTQAISRSVFVFREGKVTANSNKIFENGYSLIYSNSTLPGMSGGAVLNKAGELVGIHGRGDRTDDNQKTDFNLGIPINRFGEIASGMGVKLGAEIARVPTTSVPKADDYLVSSNSKYQAGNYQKALADLNQAISINPKSASAYLFRGFLKYQKLNDAQGALTDFDRSIFLDSKIATAYVLRGMAKANKLNDLPGALADYNQAIALNSKFASAYYQRGNLKNKLDDFRGAFSDYNQAISLNPKLDAAYFDRGFLKQNKLNDFRGALADYNRAASIKPRDKYIFFHRGSLKQRKLNDPLGALADYNQAISLDPNFALAYSLRGILKYRELGDRPGGIADNRQAAKLARKQGDTGSLRIILRFLKSWGVSE
jgi:tetratricopeptide (TPR) repeat protein